MSATVHIFWVFIFVCFFFSSVVQGVKARKNGRHNNCILSKVFHQEETTKSFCSKRKILLSFIFSSFHVMCGGQPVKADHMLATCWSHDGHMMVTWWSHDGHMLPTQLTLSFPSLPAKCCWEFRWGRSLRRLPERWPLRWSRCWHHRAHGACSSRCTSRRVAWRLTATQNSQKTQTQSRRECSSWKEKDETRRNAKHIWDTLREQDFLVQLIFSTHSLSEEHLWPARKEKIFALDVKTVFWEWSPRWRVLVARPSRASTSGRWPWKSESAKECVTTHLPNQLL